MFQSLVFSVLLFAFANAAVVPNLPNDIAANLIIVDDISKIKDANPGIELTPVVGIQERGQIRYTLGNRVSGDRLVSQSSDSYQWSAAQDVQLRLQYPASGQGAVITYVEIIVNQSSDVGQAYVTSGGIGQRYIVIIVEAYNTYYFNYVAKIFGV